MTSENFSLAWDNFEKCTTYAFEKLYSDKEFTDVTLACDGDKQLKAHKAILSSCSPFFKTVLSKNPHQHPLIYLKGISHENLSSIIKFIYLGQTEVSQEILQDFLDTAKEFQIEGFSEDMFEKQSRADSENKKLSLRKQELANENVENYDTADEKSKHTEVSQEGFSEDSLEKLKNNGKEPDIKIEIDFLVSKTESLSDKQNNDVDMTDIYSEPSEVIFDPKEFRSEIAPTRKAGSDRKYPCKQCDKQFSDPSPLSRHKKSVHEGILFTCNFCEKEFTQKGHLNIHKKSKHSL